MSFLTVKGRLLPWGDGFAVRLDRRDVERLALRHGAEVEVKVEVGGRVRPRQACAFSLGGSAADDHDVVAAEAARKDLEGRE